MQTQNCLQQSTEADDLFIPLSADDQEAIGGGGLLGGLAGGLIGAAGGGTWAVIEGAIKHEDPRVTSRNVLTKMGEGFVVGGMTGLVLGSF